MARRVAFDLLQVAERIGPQSEAAEYEDLSGEKVSPWTASLLMIGGSIGPKDDNTEELSMKSPMSVSKLADLGSGVPNYASKANGNRRRGTQCLPRFGTSQWR